jgi:glycosyltransferase involved in cell wall biosynthesis
MVVLEGMLYGLQIAASNIGGPSEISEHGDTGLLFLPKNVEALAGALLALVTDPMSRQRIGNKAAIRVREKWLWPRIVDQMTEIYAQLL